MNDRCPYPQNCNKCSSIDFNGYKNSLNVTEPFEQVGKGPKIMIIGQDPTVEKDHKEIKTPLMLDEKNSHLRAWLNDIFDNRIDELNIYATNIVKCTFDKVPSQNNGGGAIEVLKPCFDNCKEYLVKEIQWYKPDIVITLGEPAHILFVELLDGSDMTANKPFALKMKDDFNGKFYDVTCGKISFKYSPCPHMNTWNTKKAYYDVENVFKDNIKKMI